ncbi:MAG: ATP-binding cassette domain-containing protein [Bacteroidales bacterium]|nr:ATP-binding cassette domain-containing protein [Bacteroidales bacterium]
MAALFEIEGLRCSYDRDYREGVSKVVLEIRHLTLPRGKKIFIVGESGIGKSTILEVLGLMNNTIVPDSASRFVFHAPDGTAADLLELWRRGNDDELSAFRREHFNFIFQSTNLMRNFTAYENISITRMLQGYSREEAFRKASEVLRDLGLEHVGEERMAQELSGGQQQRLAFARAVIPDFTVLFGDEPTGNLDAENAARAMELLTARLSAVQGSSAIIVSHDMHLAVTFADLVIKIRKELNAGGGAADESTFRGVIDDSCVFAPGADGLWTNGTVSYTPSDFEQFLRHKQ